MPTPTSAHVSTTPECAVLERAMGATGSRSFATHEGTQPPVAELVAALSGRGWVVSGAPRLLVAASSAGLGTAIATAGRPAVIAVHQDVEPRERAWPGWDDEAVAAGYLGCLRTASWSFYVAEEESASLGPALCYPATDAERWPDSLPTASRAELLAEIVHWRTAALARWARRAADEPERTNKDLQLELTHTKNLLEATQSTLSWRLTEPLRVLQGARLKSGRP